MSEDQRSSLATEPHTPPKPLGGKPEVQNGAGQDDEMGLPLQRRHGILKECEALVVFMGRHGDVLSDDPELSKKLEVLAERVADCSEQDPSAQQWKDLVIAYAEVTKWTYGKRGVNGRSVLDTWGDTDPVFCSEVPPIGSLPKIVKFFKTFFYPKRRQRALIIAFWLSAAALSLQLLMGWAGRVSDPAAMSGIHSYAYAVAVDLGPLLVPAAWGGIGSCIFLMKRLSDKLFELAYEQSRLKGDGTRIFLGAILGVAVVQVFFPTYGETLTLGSANFGPTTAAFIAGLGVKPIYAAFEAAAEGIAARVSGRNQPNA